MLMPAQACDYGTGYFTALGTLAMAAALPPEGRITTLELDPDTAAAARRHIAASPYADRVELIEGDALASLAGLDLALRHI